MDKEYTIEIRKSVGYDMMVISKLDGDEIAEYRIDLGDEKNATRRMRRTIDRYLADGGTLGNYQW